MGIVNNNGTWYAYLGRRNGRPVRVSTKIPVCGPTRADVDANRLAAERIYSHKKREFELEAAGTREQELVSSSTPSTGAAKDPKALPGRRRSPSGKRKQNTRTPIAFPELRTLMADVLHRCFSSQVALADAMGLSQGYLSRVANGYESFSVLEALRLAVLTGYSPEQVWASCGHQEFIELHRQVFINRTVLAESAWSSEQMPRIVS